MKKTIKYFKSLFLTFCVIVTLSFSVGFVGALVDNDFELAKNLDIFASLYRELNIYYVDDLKPAKLMRTAIDAMLESLDPYTDFISETEIEDYRFMTTGQYGGIGAVISKRDKYVVITDPYEGYSAAKADLRAGDQIISVDGVSAIGKSVDEVSKVLKGSPNTEVKVIIKRPGIDKEIEKTLTREKIKVDNVQYYGMVNDSTGYINLKGFTEGAGKEVKLALTELNEKNKLKSVILDLRYNPGGLLNEAVDVSNVFIKKGLEVVHTKGKVSEWDKVHKASNNPVNTEIPLAVLVNRSSASASEIVSGVIQDYDRGVIIGQRSYGKGLVQSTRPLSYNTQIKLTTAKYYIPSGRCIQALDYSNRNEDGSVGNIPDSLVSKFSTSNGREVYDGGGIKPDIEVEQKEYSKILTSLLIKQIVFDYATYFRNKNESIPPSKIFEINEDIWNDFLVFIKGKDYDYTTYSEKTLEEFKVNAEKEKYFGAVEEEYNKLNTKVKHNKEDDIINFREDISDELKQEIASRYYYRKGRTETSFKTDIEIIKAASILANRDQYNALLSPKIEALKPAIQEGANK